MIVFSIDNLESRIKDERERPRDYKNHAYPCLLEYEDPWDFHFCGKYHFVNDPTNEKLIGAFLAEKRLAEEILRIQQEKIKNIEEWLEEIQQKIDDRG